MQYRIGKLAREAARLREEAAAARDAGFDEGFVAALACAAALRGDRGAGQAADGPARGSRVAGGAR
jgi:hypothetical protein